MLYSLSPHFCTLGTSWCLNSSIPVLINLFLCACHMCKDLSTFINLHSSVPPSLSPSSLSLPLLPLSPPSSLSPPPSPSLPLPPLLSPRSSIGCFCVQIVKPFVCPSKHSIYGGCGVNTKWLPVFRLSQLYITYILTRRSFMYSFNRI